MAKAASNVGIACVLVMLEIFGWCGLILAIHLSYLEEGTLIEELPPSDWPVCVSWGLGCIFLIYD